MPEINGGHMSETRNGIPISPFFEKHIAAESDIFGFLVDTYGFSREVGDYALEVTVRYTKGLIGIVVHLELTNLPFVRLHPLARENDTLPWPSGVPLEALVDVRCPDSKWTAAEYGDPLKLSENDLRAIFSRYAQVLTAFANDILRGDVAALHEVRALARHPKRSK
jgi:hypothetical protein